MADTIVNSGTFTSNGSRRVIKLRSGFDIFEVLNYTNAGATGNDSVRFNWRLGMDQGTGVREFKSGGGNAMNMTVLAAPNGFYVIDNNLPISFTPALEQNPLAFQDIDNNAQFTVNSTATSTLVQGNIVRLYQSAANRVVAAGGVPNLLGLDFQVGTVVANTSFQVANALANAPGQGGVSAGEWRIVSDLPLWRQYYLANVTQAVNPTVTFTTDHYFEVGDQFICHVAYSGYGMVELDGLVATVVTVPSTSTVTIDIDTTDFTAFAFPTAQNVEDNIATYAPAYVFPRVDNNTIAMVLPAGSDAPGGANNDVMYWVATKSWNQ